MPSLEVYEFQVIIPAGTPKTALHVEQMAMPPRVVDRVEIHVPPGPNGVMGFQIGSSGQQIIPVNQGAFLVASDDSWSWDLDGMITSGAWQLLGYNTGIYDHAVFVRFLVSLVPLGQNTAPVEPTLAQLSSPTGSTSGDVAAAQAALDAALAAAASDAGVS